jgi:N-terminal acetyltransferase B complex catalytic subunit
VDLFVRAGNTVAINMYRKLGYSVYRRVLSYYGGGGRDAEEDALDMRKALSRDPKGETVVPLPAPVRPQDLTR